MKKTLIIFLFVNFLLACQSNESPQNRWQTPNENQNLKLKEFQTELSDLDQSQLESIPVALELFYKKFEKKASKINDMAFLEFKKFHNRVISTISPDFIALEISNPNYSPSEINQRLHKYGIMATQTEGSLFLKNNRNFYVEKFSSFLTQTCVEYEKKIAKEDAEPFVEDGAILISIPQLVDRIVWREDLLSEPDFSQKVEVEEDLKVLKIFLFQGADNTPAFDYTSEEQLRPVNQEFKSAYQYAQEKYANKPIGKLCRDYLSVLKNERELYSQTVKNFIETALQ